MPGVLTRLGARVLVLSGAVDRGYRWFDRFRSELVAARASAEVLDRFNDLVYGGAPRYQPESGVFRAHLFPFEEHAVSELFPPPPARVLLGGAGGGREAFALAERGYEIVAFEPAPQLVEQLEQSRGKLAIRVQRGAYDDLERLFPDERFDAGIFGWGSFSHLRSHQARADALREYGRLTPGPILVSFLAVKSEPTRRLAQFRRALPRRADRDPHDVFAMSIGLYHPVDEEEVRGLAEEAGLEIVHVNFDVRETNWPHVVLRRPG
jgi:SAM-dependent methyltransferase